LDDGSPERSRQTAAESQTVAEAVGVEIVHKALQGGCRYIGQGLAGPDDQVEQSFGFERRECRDILLPGGVGSVNKGARRERASDRQVGRAIPYQRLLQIDVPLVNRSGAVGVVSAALLFFRWRTEGV